MPEYHEVKGNKDFFEICRDEETASEITIQPIKHFEGLLDAAIIFSDILVIPQAMGFEIEMVEGKGPMFVKPLRSPKDLENVNFEPNIAHELNWALKAITRTRIKLAGAVPLLGFCGAPWTLLVYMTEGQGSKMFRFAKEWIYGFTEESHKLLQAITNACVEFLAQQVVAGAQMLQVFDSWAGELGPDDFRQFCLPYLREIAEKVPQRLLVLGIKDKIPITVFAKGAWYALDELCETAYDVISLDWLFEPEQAVKIVNGRKVTLQGNLDPGIIYGKDEIITNRVKRMISGFGGGKMGYIINFGHGTHPFMDPKKVGHFLKECHKFGERGN